MTLVPPITAYGPLALGGILVTAYLWGRLTKKGTHHDSRLTWIYFAGLIGALVGAKLAFMFAEGWHYRDNILAMLTGRSITGGLLGGYLAVEIAKKRLGYANVTGDIFAIIVPVALILGRIGCVFAGCCPGMVCETSTWWTMTDGQGAARWPAAPVELLFNAAFLIWALLADRREWIIGNRFHVYLIAYGVFRFGHEFLRDDVLMFGAIGGYHLVALVTLFFGAIRYVQRRKRTTCTALAPS